VTSASIASQQTLSTSVGAFVDELVRSGVRHFCVCPGSRSTPLALTIVRHPAAKLWMHLDERSAAFFGLGLAKTLREPVVLVCTSGTAAANFMPAVVEAFCARIPLVVLTADRPHELRDVGAPQTINQINLFGAHVKWFMDLAEPDAAAEMLRYTRTVAARAVALARRGPAGPVHINCPYREPLLPGHAGALATPEARAEDRPYVSVSAGLRAPDAALAATLAADLSALPRGLIICGPHDDPGLVDEVTRLGGALGYPILADPLSGLRNGNHDRALVLVCYDAFLRDAAFVERFAPQVVLRFGAMPVSKPLLLYLQRHQGCRQIVVDGDGGWNEPTLLASDMIYADARLLCEAVLRRGVAAVAGSSTSERATDATAIWQHKSSAWAGAWQSADRSARAAIAARFEVLDELFEGRVFAELGALLPAGATLTTPAQQNAGGRGGQPGFRGRPNNQGAGAAATPPTPAETSQSNARMLLMSLQTMQPQIDQYLPERSLAVRQKITELGLNNDPRGNFGQMAALMQQGTSESLMTAAAND